MTDIKEGIMKKRFYLAGIAALVLALSLTGCGADVGIISSEDGPTGIYVGDNTITFDDNEDDAGEEDDGEAPLPAAPEGAPVSKEDAAPEDPGTTGDGEQLYADLDGLDEDGTYNSAEDVSLYLYTYGHLPENYITKNEARDLGWSGGSVEKYAPGYAIGGDKFGNREGVLPDGTYHECDIDTIGQDSRGAKRLVYADDGRIYYTEDHYETFTLLYGEE